MADEKRQLLKDKVKKLPTTSGCYLMYNQQKEILYIGKAKNLRNRVSSYFKLEQDNLKTKALVEQIDDIEFILTSNEIESLVLENNLIKEHLPKYNIRLRDDKSYPYIQWNNQELYPRLEYTRRPKKSKHYSLLGPFPEGFSFGRTLQSLTKLLKLRDCTSTEFAKRKTPCLLYQMEQCLAPCVRLCTPQEYNDALNLVIDFLKKPKEKSELNLYCEKRMQQFSEEEQFEKAAQWRDVWKELMAFIENYEQQKVESLSTDENIDFIGQCFSSEECDISIYKVRNGRLIGMQHFYWLKMSNEEDELDEISSQLLNYYQQERDLPQKVVTDWPKESMDLFQAALTKILPGKNKVTLQTKTKNFTPLLEQAMQHASEKARIRQEEQKQTMPILIDLKNILQLEKLPRIIECFDVAIWQGSSPTASQVVFVDGRPSKKEYRYYHLEQREEGNNDYAMMEEVLKKRFKKGRLPDLIVIDGGKGQLGIAKKVLTELKIFIPVIALAKEKNEHGVKERVFLALKSEALNLDYAKPGSKLLMHIRDEAHRFSRRLHHHAEKKRLLGFEVRSDVK